MWGRLPARAAGFARVAKKDVVEAGERGQRATLAQTTPGAPWNTIA